MPSSSMHFVIRFVFILCVVFKRVIVLVCKNVLKALEFFLIYVVELQNKLHIQAYHENL